MNKYRLMDLSFYYTLKQKADELNIVNFREGFLEVDFEKAEIPLVVFDNTTIFLSPKEVGNREQLIRRGYNVIVYAQNKKQRDDLIYEFISVLEGPIIVYNYNEGFPPDVTPSKIGCLRFEDISVSFLSYGRPEDTTMNRYVGDIKVTYLYDYC